MKEVKRKREKEKLAIKSGVMHINDFSEEDIDRPCARLPGSLALSSKV